MVDQGNRAFSRNILNMLYVNDEEVIEIGYDRASNLEDKKRKQLETGYFSF